MTETFTPLQAAQAFAEAHRWEGSLVRRTEGLTWMVWGLVTAGIFTTLGTLVFLEFPALVVVIGWSSWAVLGAALTFAIWRSAAFSGHEEVRPFGWTMFFAKAAVLAALVLVLHFVIRPQTIVAPMLLVAVLWGTVALFGVRLSQVGRIVALVSSLTILGMGVILDLVALSMTQTMMVGISLMTGVPFLAGLYQTIRG